MAHDKSFAQSWEDQQRRLDDWQPPRSLSVWAAIGSAGLTMAIGFTLGGWTTKAGAEKMAELAARAARAELVATVCATNFANGYDFEARLAALMKATDAKRPAMLQDEGWVTLAGLDAPFPLAARLCADKLATAPPASEENAMSPAEGSSG